jgi:O-methyltransferase
MNYLAYVRRLVRSVGYSAVKGAGLPLIRSRAVSSGVHEMIFPYATYSPWLVDHDFQRAFVRVKQNTLVDPLRCYELWQLVEQTKGVPGALLEVGVWRGGTGALIAARAKQLSIDDTVFLCDTFTGVVKTTKVDTYYQNSKHADTSLAVVQRLTSQMNLDNVRTLQGVFPDQTGHEVAGLTFRFVHIDVDVYESAREVLEFVWPRLSPGGVVVFDDYGFASTPGVTRLVDEQRVKPGRTVVHNLNGHGLLFKAG